MCSEDNRSANINKFMEFICRKNQKDDMFRTFGESPAQLMEESGLDFGDTNNQNEAFFMLLREGLIVAIDYPKAGHLDSFTKIRPSEKATNIYGRPG